MKRGIAPKNAVEIDSLQAYFQFSCKVYKKVSNWFAELICFATPKLHFATHSLRIPGLDDASVFPWLRFVDQTLFSHSLHMIVMKRRQL